MRSYFSLFASVFAILILSSMTAFAQSDDIARSIKLKKSERDALNTSIPGAVRNFLETADSMVVFAHLKLEGSQLKPAMEEKFVPNFKSKVETSTSRTTLLRTFFSDAAKGSSPAVCFIPSHSIVAIKGDKRVEVTICFACNRFIISGEFGRSEGSFSREDGKFEAAVSNLTFLTW